MFKRLWGEITKPSKYDIWDNAYNKLQGEKHRNGKSKEYWRIWNEEVCPAYIKMTESHRIIGVGYDSLTCQILNDIKKEI